MSKKIAGAIKLHSKVVMKENIFKSSKKYFSEKNSYMCSVINKLQWLDKSKYYLIKVKNDNLAKSKLIGKVVPSKFIGSKDST